jgi:hypothetical protein
VKARHAVSRPKSDQAAKGRAWPAPKSGPMHMTWEKRASGRAPWTLRPRGKLRMQNHGPGSRLHIALKFQQSDWPLLITFITCLACITDQIGQLPF